MGFDRMIMWATAQNNNSLTMSYTALYEITNKGNDCSQI
jgi:hypothetical protein